MWTAEFLLYEDKEGNQPLGKENITARPKEIMEAGKKNKRQKKKN